MCNTGTWFGGCFLSNPTPEVRGPGPCAYTVLFTLLAQNSVKVSWIFKKMLRRKRKKTEGRRVSGEYDIYFDLPHRVQQMLCSPGMTNCRIHMSGSRLLFWLGSLFCILCYICAQLYSCFLVLFPAEWGRTYWRDGVVSVAWLFLGHVLLWMSHLVLLNRSPSRINPCLEERTNRSLA